MTSTETVWENARKDYVQGITQEDKTKHFPTYNEIAKTYEMALGTVKNRGSTEKWPDQRKRYKFRVTKKVQEKKGHDLGGMDPAEVDEAAEVDAEAIVQSNNDFEKTGSDLRKAVQKQVDIALKYPETVNPYHLKMLGDALTAAQNAVKNAQDEILERNKLELEGELKAEHRYKHTLELLGTDEFREQDLGVLRAICEKEENKS